MGKIRTIPAACRIAATAALLVALGACEKLEQLATPPQATVKPTPVSTGPATGPGSAEPEPPRVLPAELAIIHQIIKWDSAPRTLKTKVAEEVSRRVGDMKFKGLETFSSGGVTREVAIYTHEKSGLEFSLVPGGRFKMGSSSGESDRGRDEDQHTVTLTRGFLMSRTEVTQAACRKALGENPSAWKGNDMPAETISYVKAAKLARRLRCVIPTEAEWEYACRAGTTGSYSFGKSSKDLDAHGWFSENAGEKTHPVAQKKPNAFGLYDMHGNVWEWTTSGFGKYPSGSVTDPEGDKSSGHKSTRGGGFNTMARTQRSAFRYEHHTSDKHEGLGVRIVKVLKLD